MTALKTIPIKRFKKEEQRWFYSCRKSSQNKRVDREKNEALKRKNRIQGYDATADEGVHSRNIEFRGQDSSTVIT
jgi:hypothetical protein